MATDESKRDAATELDDDIEENEEAELTRDDLVRLKEELARKREEVFANYQRHVSEAMEDNENLPDEMDIAERQSRHAYLFRLADKEQKLLREIDHALTKFERGTYGICEGTGEAIGLKRLNARPWTRYSLEYKQELERKRGK